MIDKIIVLILLALLLFGGLGEVVLEVKLCILLVSVLVVAVLAIREGSIKIPKHFLLYCLYLVVLLVSLFWSKSRNSAFGALVLYIDGGLFWLIFYNFNKRIRNLFLSGVVFLGLVFGGIFVYTLITGKIFVNAFNLYSPLWFDSSHVHLGDYWMFCLLILYYFFLREKIVFKKALLAVLIVVGFYFLVASSTRSALVGLTVGVFYLHSAQFFKKKYNKFTFALLGILLFVFLFISGHRTTLFSRGYIIQGMVGLVRTPLGVGMGNFYLTSSDKNNQILGFDQVSSVAHNFIIENTSGVGALAIIFIYWLLQILLEIFRREINLYSALFLALTINFMFDFTYLIPAMFCLWFAFLALSQASAKLTKGHLEGLEG